jgi:hypothetical protein
MYKWFIGFVLVLFVMWYIIIPSNDISNQSSKKGEHFGEIKQRLHAKIDCNGNAVYYSPQSPTMNGELGCTQIPCPENPEKFGDNITCWSCCNY